MKIVLSLAAFAVVMSATTTQAALASSAKAGLRRNLDSSTILSSPAVGQSSSSNEMCIATGEEPLSKTKGALLQSLAKRVVNSSGSVGSGNNNHHVDLPKYLFGCSLFSFHCYVCDLCQDIYSLLIETGSEPACDAICATTAEAAGGGPEDPVADAVALDCAALCEAIFSAAGDGTAIGACTFADLC